MTTEAEAHAALKARQIANFNTIPVRWDDDAHDELDDAPAAFAWCELVPQDERIEGYGGGRGGNLFRTPAILEIRVFVPIGQGATTLASTHAQALGAVFRGQRFSGVSCFGAPVRRENSPPDRGNYATAICTVDLHYDLTA